MLCRRGIQSLSPLTEIALFPNGVKTVYLISLVQQLGLSTAGVTTEWKIGETYGLRRASVGKVRLVTISKNHLKILVPLIFFEKSEKCQKSQTSKIAFLGVKS